MNTVTIITEFSANEACTGKESVLFGIKDANEARNFVNAMYQLRDVAKHTYGGITAKFAGSVFAEFINGSSPYGDYAFKCEFVKCNRGDLNLADIFTTSALKSGKITQAEHDIMQAVLEVLLA